MNSFNSWNEAIDNSEKKEDKINGEEDSSILLIKELLIYTALLRKTMIIFLSITKPNPLQVVRSILRS